MKMRVYSIAWLSSLAGYVAGIQRFQIERSSRGQVVVGNEPLERTESHKQRRTECYGSNLIRRFKFKFCQLFQTEQNANGFKSGPHYLQVVRQSYSN